MCERHFGPLRSGRLRGRRLCPPGYSRNDWAAVRSAEDVTADGFLGEAEPDAGGVDLRCEFVGCRHRADEDRNVASASRGDLVLHDGRHLVNDVEKGLPRVGVCCWWYQCVQCSIGLG